MSPQVKPWYDFYIYTHGVFSSMDCAIIDLDGLTNIKYIITLIKWQAGYS